MLLVGCASQPRSLCERGARREGSLPFSPPPTPAAEEVETLIARGNAAVAAMGSTQDPGGWPPGALSCRSEAAALRLPAPACQAPAPLLLHGTAPRAALAPLPLQLPASPPSLPPLPCPSLSHSHQLKLPLQRTCARWRPLTC